MHVIKFCDTGEKICSEMHITGGEKLLDGAKPYFPMVSTWVRPRPAKEVSVYLYFIYV